MVTAMNNTILYPTSTSWYTENRRFINGRAEREADSRKKESSEPSAWPSDGLEIAAAYCPIYNIENAAEKLRNTVFRKKWLNYNRM